MQYNTCKNCAYWFRRSKKGAGECRRHAPAPMYSMTGDKPVSIWWPQTRDMFWCGDFKQRADVVVDTLDLGIEELNLPTRAYNALINDYIHTIGDLVNKTEHQILRLPYMGRKMLNEIKEALAERNLHLSLPSEKASCQFMEEGK